jgi:hypothetical protein
MVQESNNWPTLSCAMVKAALQKSGVLQLDLYFKRGSLKIANTHFNK